MSTSSLWREAKKSWAPSAQIESNLPTKAERQGRRKDTSGGRCLLTVWRELVPLKHSDAEDLLLQVFDEELAVGIPLGIQSVLDGLGDVTLGAHGHLTVRVTLS